MELLLPRCVVAYGLSVTEELVLVGDEAFEADRASGVDLGGGDADFCAEAVAEAVSEAGGGILIDACGVDKCHEAFGSRFIFRHDAVGVMAAEGIDVGDRFVEVADELDGKGEGEVFLVEAFALRNDIDRDDGIHLFRAADRDAGIGEGAGELRQKILRDAPMDKDGLDCVAGGGILHLGIHDGGDGDFFLIVLVDVDMAHAVRMAEDRDRGVRHDVLHECIRAARDEEVDGFVTFEELVDLIVLLGLEQRILRKTGSDGGLLDQAEEDAVGVGRFFAALQDGTVAALQAEGGDLYQRIGAGFEDDADDADGAGHTVEREPFVELAGERHAIDRIRQSDEAGELCFHVSELSFIEFETLLDGRGDAAFFCQREVFAIGGKDLFFACKERFTDEGECVIPFFERSRSQNGRGELHFAGFFFDVHGRVLSGGVTGDQDLGAVRRIKRSAAFVPHPLWGNAIKLSGRTFLAPHRVMLLS